MSTAGNDSKEQTSDTYIFVNTDNEPIITDKNPAHFDGLIDEIADCCTRTGQYLQFLKQGVVIMGHRTITDSPANPALAPRRVADFEPCELAKPPEAASWRTMPSSELLRSFHVEPASSGDVGRPHERVRAPRRSGD